MKAKLREQRGSTVAAARARAKKPERPKTAPIARDLAVLSKALPRTAQPNRAQAAINLQRTIGNQAVLRLLRQAERPARDPTRPASTAALAPHVAPAPEAGPQPRAKAKPEAAREAQPVGNGAEASAAAAEPAAAKAAPGAEEPRTPGTQRPAEEKGQEARTPDVAREPPAQQDARPGEQAPRSPKEDPAFQAVLGRVRAVAEQQGHNNPAQAKAAQAQAAAQGPANEVEAQAAAGQVGKMGAQQPQPFDKAAFKQAVLQKVEGLAPGTLKDLDEFKSSGKVSQVKGAVTAQVTAGKEAAQSAIKQTTEEPPSAAGIQPKPVTPLPANDPGAPPPDVGAGAAAPKPKLEAEVSLDASSKSLDQQMADANVTEEQLKKSNEPEFQAALDAKTEAQAHAKTAPTAYRQDEQPLLAAAQAQAEAGSDKALQGMHATRGKAFTKIGDQQHATKGKDEQARAKISGRLQEIYNATKNKVEGRLKKLDDDVDGMFDKGAEGARQEFEDYVAARFKVWKAERYSANPALWLVDCILPYPPETEKFYTDGKANYVKRMSDVIDKVAATVEAGLTEAKGFIAAGWQEVQTYVKSLPTNLAKVGQEAAAGIQGSFDHLRQSVDDKRDQLIDQLAQKYVDSVKKIDDRIQQMKEESKGLFDQAKNAMGGVIETIRNLKQMLLGILAKAADAIDKIIKDPIGFLGNLVAGVKQGLQRFVGKIASHLQKGLMGWLFGAVAEAGIQLPEKLDLQGIISLALQILGMTYAFFRKRAVALLGEPIVQRLEEAAEVFKVLLTEGVAGLWRFIKDKVGDLKSMVLDGIMSLVRDSIIMAGITWIIGLLNPAGAFVKACKLIYDIIMFFVERGSQIMSLVTAVVDSVSAIASGAIGVAAAAVENALAKALPVTISFLASLLGLSGISQKIRKIIEKVQAPVGKAIDGVIHQAAKLIKKAGGFVKGLSKGERGKLTVEARAKRDRRERQENSAERHRREQREDERRRREQLDRAVRAIRPAADALLGRGVSRIRLSAQLAIWRIRHRIRTLRIVQSGGTARLEAANSPTRITNTWFKKNRSEIYQMIRRIAKERYRTGPQRRQPEIADVFGDVPQGETVAGVFAGQRRAIQRAREGERGDVVFGSLRGDTVRGESYGPLASRIAASGVTGPELGAEMTAALGRGSVTPDIADLTALSFGAEISRSRRHGGTAEVSSRLAVAGLREGRLGVEEAFGTAAASRAHNEAQRNLQEQRGRGRGSAATRRREKRLRLATGGLVPETMRGYSSAREIAARLADPTRRSPRAGTIARRAGEETINRTVELVYRAVGDNDYKNLADLERDICSMLDRVDRMIIS